MASQCNTQDSCDRCEAAGQNCVFDRSRRLSKDDLRAEIQRLKQSNEEQDALLDTLSSRDYRGSYNLVTQDLLDDSKTRQAVFQELVNIKPGKVHHAGSSVERPSQTVSATESGSDMPPAVSPRCHGTLSLPQPQAQPLSPSGAANSIWSSPCHSERNLLVEASEADNFAALGLRLSSVRRWILSTSPSTASDDLSLSRIDKWTRTGWTVGFVQQLLNSLILWDYLPFCLLCKDPFLQDYTAGRDRYCSSALVNALLALATRIISKDQYELQQQDGGYGSNEISPFAQRWSGGDSFFEEAEALLNEEPLTSLPNIQALGILALYHVSCGREANAKALAEDFAAAMTDLCLREPLVGKQEERYACVRATAYCGAVSLLRILRLTSAQSGTIYANMVQDDGVSLDQGPGNYETCSGDPLAKSDPNVVRDAQGLQLSHLQSIPAKIFQLTEWVYKVLASSQLHSPNTHASVSEVMAVYTKCLDWYQSFFALLKTDESNSPFVLFVHRNDSEASGSIYYQYCLLCLFRPFMGVVFENLDVQPRQIGLQAAQSIVALSQSYAAIFSQGRTYPFGPYFVSASGQLSLAVEAVSRRLLNSTLLSLSAPSPVIGPRYSTTASGNSGNSGGSVSRGCGQG
ncbi:hypothetical protein HIM_11497 [Hirsutella minnesotensis 3608]|uniref:Transcription factor domain-containing protein n=1 Tax=Hirsutella minnesotensis 3608 TaxID=1043627 RepID=A0A0F7ZWK0_9HYPO|nr:hypothetical protein HIM_11497 [Hirsutella minnesotensis 3608]